MNSQNSRGGPSEATSPELRPADQLDADSYKAAACQAAPAKDAGKLWIWDWINSRKNSTRVELSMTPQADLDESVKSKDVAPGAQNVNLAQHFRVGRSLWQRTDTMEAVRLWDQQKVALKFLKRRRRRVERAPPESVPSEVSVMMELRNVPTSCVIQMLSWFQTERHCILVLECPADFQDLEQFLDEHGGSMRSEAEAQAVMRRVAQAAFECRRRGIVHGNIHARNVLVHRRDLRIKLMDFHAATLTQKIGKLQQKEMFSDPATVYSLGLLLYRMMCGRYPDKRVRSEVSSGYCHRGVWSCFRKPNADRDVLSGLSKDLLSLMHQCLQKKPHQRISLFHLQFNSWITGRKPVKEQRDARTARDDHA